ncbi:MAG: hypothetical protein SFW35_03880 [Chitinophagales bacterium]|nr:hypothetical protein [Chitinophagales bacterium]
MTQEQRDHLQDLSEIRNLMQRSSRFISLSGLSGISVGICALIGAAVAYWFVDGNVNEYYVAGQLFSRGGANYPLLTFIAIDGALILFSAIAFGIFFTTRKARKDGLKVWDLSSQRLLINLAIPLVAGGLLCLIMLYHGTIGYVPPMTLLFYGMALINASKYTLNDIRYLGLLEILLGLLSAVFLGYGFYFWVLGFGILHIVYGTVMYFKYER